MMNAVGIYQLALRAYPGEYRDECGAEVVETALELNGGRWSFRETMGLLLGGLRARARIGTSGEGAGLWISGLRLALFFLAIDGLAYVMIQPPTSVPSYFWPFVVVEAALLLVMTFTTGKRYAIVVSAVTAASLLVILLDNGDGLYRYRFMALTGLLVAATWIVALRSDGRRAAPPLALVPLLVVWSGLLALAPDFVYGGIPFQSYGHMFVLISLVLTATALATIDPRLLAGTLVWLAVNAVWASFVLSLRFHVLDLLWLAGITAVAAAVLGIALTVGSRRLAQT